jgi:hypothetical protein
MLRLGIIWFAAAMMLSACGGSSNNGGSSDEAQYNELDPRAMVLESPPVDGRLPADLRPPS